MISKDWYLEPMITNNQIEANLLIDKNSALMGSINIMDCTAFEKMMILIKSKPWIYGRLTAFEKNVFMHIADELLKEEQKRLQNYTVNEKFKIAASALGTSLVFIEL